jgi:hypothetical protein
MQNSRSHVDDGHGFLKKLLANSIAACLAATEEYVVGNGKFPPRNTKL